MSNAPQLLGDYGQLSLQANGGMIGPAKFNLPGMDPINPLTCPNWHDRPGAEDWLPLIKNLCGDFVCAPYGAPDISEALPQNWKQNPEQKFANDNWFHGFAVNNLWDVQIDKDNSNSGQMICYPPAPHPFEHVSRKVSLLPDGPGYQVELNIAARSDIKFPFSLHPCFLLPEQPGSLNLEVATAGSGWTYPVSLIDENAPIATNARFEGLNAVPLIDGKKMDLTKLPPDEPFEALVQIGAPKGKVRLVYEKLGFEVIFSYDAELLPSLVIWISNCGRTEAPFDGKFRTLGIEAVAGAFDLGPQASCSIENPIAKEGISTFVELAAGEKLTTTSEVRLQAL
ncbi:MAG: hypothetical protein L3J21_07925 [Devosiaceae bacterium]|nr:hypothetical protein [Devosiaceae bacterium]